jgi:hypothetical protein
MPAPKVTATTNTRFDHSNCKHARTGAEGKKARAACRKAHAAEAAKATPAKAKTPASPRTKRAVKKTVAAVSVPDTTNVEADELADADI